MGARVSGPVLVAVALVTLFAAWTIVVSCIQSASMRAHRYELQISPAQAAATYERIESGEVAGW